MLFDPDFKTKFQDIRCFDDTEVEETLSALHESQRLTFVFSLLFPGEDINTDGLYRCKSIDEIQDWLLRSLVPKLAASYESLTVKGLENLNPDCKYLFVSNHRDIAMDPLLVNLALHDNGFETAHNAIGDNLLLSVTGTRMSLLNKCFRIARSIRSPKAMLIAMKKQAEYIRTLRLELNQSVWIAQREGRALDSHDRTNPALVKMLTLGLDRSQHAKTLSELAIVPVTINYEWDPCDISKAKRVLGEGQRSAEDKLASDKLDILSGLRGFKGKIVTHFGTPIPVEASFEANDAYDDLARQIDREIHSRYEIQPINRLARKVLQDDFDEALLTEQKLADYQELNRRLSAIETHPQFDNVRKALLKAYAMPLKLKENTAS